MRWRDQSQLVRVLVVVCGTVFFFQMLKLPQIESTFFLSRQGLADGQIWRLISYAILHGNFFHLFFNLFVLWIFVPAILSRLGQRRLTIISAIAITLGGLAHIVFSPAGVIGISAMVYAVLVMTAWYWPRQTILVFFFIPMPMYLFVILLAGMEILMTMQPGSMTAHWAHLGGIVTGLAAAMLLSGRSARGAGSGRQRLSLKDRVGFILWKRKVRKRNAMQARVDLLLEKITKTGISS
jgi:membrane associated rhomboid family serine protease